MWGMEELAKHLLPEEDRDDIDKVSIIMAWLLCTWDAAHRLELTIGDVRKDKPSVARQIEVAAPHRRIPPPGSPTTTAPASQEQGDEQAAAMDTAASASQPEPNVQQADSAAPTGQQLRRTARARRPTRKAEESLQQSAHHLTRGVVPAPMFAQPALPSHHTSQEEGVVGEDGDEASEAPANESGAATGAASAREEGELPSVEWYAKISELISDIYTKFSYGQRYESLLDIANDMDTLLYALKRFCDTRFAQSEHKVYQNFVRNYIVLLKGIRDKIAGPKVTEKERVKMQGWLDNGLQNYWFMAEVTCLVPLLEKCMNLSLEMQTVNTIPWELIDDENRFFNEMLDMRDALRLEQGFSEEHFPFLHRRVHGQAAEGTATYAEFLKSGELLGERLAIHCATFPADNPECTQAQAYTDLQHFIADWIENMVHFFQVRFVDDEHEMIAVAAKCLDLRLYCRKSFPGYSSLAQYMDAEVKQPFRQVWKWVSAAGVNVEPWEASWTALQNLARCLHEDVTSFYAWADSEESRHKWHDKDCNVNVSGTVIQEQVLTDSKFYEGAKPALHIYCMTVLKTANEAVVEAMCGFVDKHAVGQRGLSFAMYAYESIVHFNMPSPARSDQFIKDALRLYGQVTQQSGIVRFLSTDKKQRYLTTDVSEVVDRRMAEESKLSFM